MKLKKENIDRFYELFKEKGVPKFQAKKEIREVLGVRD